jgi:hypothetical protein
MFNDPSAATTNLPMNEYIQPDLGHAARIWWAFFWPTTLISSVLGFALGAALRMLYENTATSAKLILWTSRIGGYAINYAVAMAVMYYVLGKRFRHFRIGLLAASGSGSEELGRTFQRTLRVWWAFTWRTVIYGLVAWVVVAMPMGWFVGIFNPGPAGLSLFGALMGLVLGGGVALFVIYSSILDEELGDFRVCLLPRTSGPLGTTAAVGDPFGAQQTPS